MPAWIPTLLELLKGKTTPACLAGIVALGAAGYTYAEGRLSEMSTRVDSLAATVELGFEKQALRLSLSDLERDIDVTDERIRDAERDAADLEMLAETVPDPSLLQARVRELRQDIQTMQRELTADEAECRVLKARLAAL